MTYDPSGIKVLTLDEAIRKRPGMFIGDVESAEGANNIVFELVANVIDQFLADRATRCSVDLSDFDVCVVDDGPGLSFAGKAENASVSGAQYTLENLHFRANANGHVPHVHLVFNGVGLAAVNALCSQFKLTSRDGVHEWQLSYEKGKLVGEVIKVKNTAASGTTISLRLDEEIFQRPPDRSQLATILSEKIHLFPGLGVVLNGLTMSAERGLLSLAEDSYQGDTEPSLWHRKEYADFHIDLALIGNAAEPVVSRSWVNGVLTQDGGSHQRALDKALSKQNVSPAVSLIHVIMKRPEFAGPCKDELLAPDLEGQLEAAFLEALATQQ